MADGIAEGGYCEAFEAMITEPFKSRVNWPECCLYKQIVSNNGKRRREIVAKSELIRNLRGLDWRLRGITRRLESFTQFERAMLFP